MLKDAYLKELTELTNEFRKQSIILKEEGSNDEAILETIKANICDIFCKVFNVSYNKAFKSSKNTNECYKNLYNFYTSFFNKIPAPWIEKMAKDMEYGMMEEYYKEQIKLETVNKIKDLFEKYYNKYYKEA